MSVLDICTLFVRAKTESFLRDSSSGKGRVILEQTLDRAFKKGIKFIILLQDDHLLGKIERLGFSMRKRFNERIMEASQAGAKKHVLEVLGIVSE